MTRSHLSTEFQRAAERWPICVISAFHERCVYLYTLAAVCDDGKSTVFVYRVRNSRPSSVTYFARAASSPLMTDVDATTVLFYDQNG